MTLLLPQQLDLPYAEPTPLSAEFWTACSRHELLFQRCTTCAMATFPPAELCRNCLQPDLKWEVSAGRGNLYSWTIVWRPVTEQFEVPYAPAIVELNEGFQLVTNVIGIVTSALRIELPVEVVFHEINDRLTLPLFQPLDANSVSTNPTDE
jgi:uncharacterized protein